MADISLAAWHLLRLMRSDMKNRFSPLRNKNEEAAMEELVQAGYVQRLLPPGGEMFVLTMRGMEARLTFD